jgi:CRISPR-associated protein Cmr6
VSDREQGTVKRFFSDGGYGFLEREGEDDLFFHVSNLESETRIEEGMRLEFGVGPGREGPEAKRITVVDEGGSEAAETGAFDGGRPDERRRGTVETFKGDQGYGFLDYGEEDNLFFHVSNLIEDLPVEEGMTLEFEIGEGREGPEAKEITSPGGLQVGRRPLYRSEDFPDEKPTEAHAGLWFDKFCDQWVVQGDRWTLREADPHADRAELQTSGKEAWLDDFTSRPVGDSEALAEVVERRERLVDARDGWQGTLTAESRFVTGMGREHPVENGFAWHETLGTPYLPGSGLKGVLRTWATRWTETDPATVDRIFGDHDDETIGVGSIVFLEAVPASPVELEVDVMTPHYQTWHQEGPPRVPADWHDPTPIPFLVTAAGSDFHFALLPRVQNDTCRKDLDVVTEWIDDALEWLGVGAKTAVGYGRFKK